MPSSPAVQAIWSATPSALMSNDDALVARGELEARRAEVEDEGIGGGYEVGIRQIPEPDTIERHDVLNDHSASSGIRSVGNGHRIDARIRGAGGVRVDDERVVPYGDAIGCRRNEPFNGS